MKKIINLLLSACVLLSLTGCNKSEEHVEPVIDTGIYTLNDFESNAEFNLIRLNGVLGRVEKNVDEAYVKTGLASAKVTVEANPYKPGAPYIQQAFELKKAGKDFRNFSSVSMLSVDVYNATGGKARIGMQLNYEFSNGTRKNFELEEGWNTVRFNVKQKTLRQH